MEPLASSIGLRLPQLSILNRRAEDPISWDGDKISYYKHQDRKADLPAKKIVLLVGEWLIFWGFFWLRVLTSPIRRWTRPQNIAEQKTGKPNL